MNKFKLKNLIIISSIFLVSCGNQGQSSSVIDSNQNSQSSVVFEFQPVKEITITTSTDLLVQNITNLRQLVINADTNQGVEPNLVFEWYVNGNKSFQLGKVFEYTPTSVGTYNIQARIGGITSNQLRLVVNEEARVIQLTSIVMNNNKIIQVVAEEGLEFEAQDNVIANSSTFNLSDKRYNLILNKEIVQGSKFNLIIKKSGYPNLIREVLFDNRKITVSDSTIDNIDIKSDQSGNYIFEKPNIVLANGLRAQLSNEKVLRLSFKTENLDGNDLPYSIENYSAPTNVSLTPTTRGNVNIEKGNVSSLQFIYRININTIVGNYKFRVTINGKATDISINVVEPNPSLVFERYSIFDSELEENVLYNLSYRFGVKTNPGSLTGRVGVNPINQVYTIEKDFLEFNFIELEFKVNAQNFKVDNNFLDNTALNPNQLSVSLNSPENTSFVKTDNDLTQLSLPTAKLFRGFYSSDFIIRQRFDHTSLAGQYVFTIVGGQPNISATSITVRINLVDAKPKISSIININDSASTLVANMSNPLVANINDENRFIVYKPTQASFDNLNLSIDLVVANFESKTLLSGDFNRTYLGKNQANTVTVIKELLVYKQSISGPSTFSVENNKDTLVGLEAGRNPNSSQLNEYSNLVNGVRVVNNRALLSSDVKTYPLYRTSTSSNQNQIIIPSAFSISVNHLTIAGIYLFNVEIGTLKYTATIEILEITNNIEFKLDTTSNIVEFDEVKDQYVANLNKDGQLQVEFILDIFNANFLSKNQVSYSLTRSSPLVNNELVASNIAYSLIAGNDGHVKIPDIVSILHRNSGSLLIDKVGVYRFELSIEGKTRVLTLIVNEYPSLTIDSLLINEEIAIKYFDENFVFETIAAPIRLVFEGKAVNLKGELYYRIIAGNPDFTDKSTVLGELDYNNGPNMFEFELQAINSTQRVSIMIYEKPSKISNNYKVIGHKTFDIYFLNLIP